jgi:hypothetical protein
MEGESTTEEMKAAQAGVPFAGPSPPDGHPGEIGEKPKRRRRTKAEMDAERQAAEEAAAKELPLFHYSVTPDGHIRVWCERTLRTAPYESFSFGLHADFPRDPRLGVEDNIFTLGVAVTRQSQELEKKLQGELVFVK